VEYGVPYTIKKKDKVTKKLNKIVATYNIEDVDLKWEELRLQDGLGAITTAGDILFFTSLNI